MYPYIKTETTLTFVNTDENKTYSVDSSHPNWNSICNAIETDDSNYLMTLVDIPKTISKYGKGIIEVVNGVVFYKQQEVHNSLTDRILKMISEGFNITPMVHFMENLMENPSKQSIDNLYRFLEHNQLPITDDGYFLAYKNVGDNYKDKHSGTFDNSVGAVCEMPRNQVQDDPNITCSDGLHFCSIEYLKGFWGTSGHTMIIKINPADVVSIPTDYNNAKGRCCKYEVIGEHMDGTKDTLSEHTVYSTGYNDNGGYPFWYDPNKKSFYNKRDSKGRFTK